jgi:hypothetical protein
VIAALVKYAQELDTPSFDAAIDVYNALGQNGRLPRQAYPLSSNERCDQIPPRSWIPGAPSVHCRRP